MRTTHALVFSLSLLGATAGPAAVAPPPALAEDPAVAEARALVEKAEKMLAELSPGDPAGTNEVIKANNQAIQKLNALARKGATPEWKELTERAKATDKGAREKVKQPKPAAPAPPPPAPPPSGGTPAPAPAPAEPAKPGELEWSGEPDLSNLGSNDQSRFQKWKDGFAAVWEKLKAQPPLELAQDPAGQKREYEKAIQKLFGTFRDPGQFTAKCKPFASKKNADFWAFFESRLAEGKSQLEAAKGQSDDALRKGMADADALDADLKGQRAGDKAAAEKLLERRAAIAALLETSAAKLNPAWKKTADRLAAMKERIERRAAGQADDPSLAVDISDAPYDGLTKHEQDCMEKWKGSFSRTLKAMCAWDDVKLAQSNQVQTLKNDLDRARQGSVGDSGLNASIYEYVKKKEAEYLAILDGKVKNGEKLIAADAAEKKGRWDEAEAIAAEIQAAAELTAANWAEMDINWKMSAEDEGEVIEFAKNRKALRDAGLKWAEKAKRMAALLHDAPKYPMITFSGRVFMYEQGDALRVADWIARLPSKCDGDVETAIGWFDKKVTYAEENVKPIDLSRDQAEFQTCCKKRFTFDDDTDAAAWAAKFAEAVEREYRGSAGPEWAARLAKVEAQRQANHVTRAGLVAKVRFPADREHKDAALRSAAEEAFKRSKCENVRRFIAIEKANEEREVRFEDRTARLYRWKSFPGYAVAKDNAGDWRIFCFTAKWYFEGGKPNEEWFVTRWEPFEYILEENIDK
jgi:hypothetical protein